MSGIIPIVMAHDTTCKKGDEWICHWMADGKEAPNPKDESNTSTKKEIEDAKIECIVLCIMLLVVIGLCGIYYLIMH